MAASSGSSTLHRGRLFQIGKALDGSASPDGPAPINMLQSLIASSAPTSGSSETFSQLYLLSTDSNTGATSVTFGEAPNETVDLAKGSILFGGEQFTVSGAPHNDGTYTYIGEAKVGNTVIGFTGFNQYGQQILFSNDANLAYGSSLVVLDGIDTTICFMAGTRIATPDGDVSVETLRIGDLVCTLNAAAMPVRWIGLQTVSTQFADPLRVNPIRIAAGALDENVPSRDLRVSPDHALLVGDALVEASALVNGSTIIRETELPASFVYYHVELEDHSLILAEGVPAETFVDNVERLAFDNWAEHEALYPNAANIGDMDRPRAKSHRQVPYSVRELLTRRANVLSGSIERAA